MKTYSSKANANRAAKTQGLNPVDYAVYQNGDVWVLEVIGNDLLAVDNKEAWELEAEKEAAIPHISVIDNPVKQVWVIADNMWGERRKDIIAACVAAGIAYNTARTQYQAFYKVKSQEEAK